jgi:hypothetical protein
MNRHKHADVIHAYAEGAKIEWRMDDEDRWRDCQSPGFVEYYQYRVKPEDDPQPAKQPYSLESWSGEWVRCVYDGKTSLCRVLCIDEIGISVATIGNVIRISWDSLIKMDYEWSNSIDGPWHPCYR